MNCRWTENNRFLLSALLVSLAVNLAIIGYVASFLFHHNEATHDDVIHERIEGLLSLLPKQSRTSVSDDLNAQTADVRKNLQLIHKERRHIQHLIRSEDVTEEQLNIAFTRLRELHSETQRIYQQAFAKAVAELPPDQRQLTGKAVKERHQMVKKPTVQK